ncbi:MAG: SDR family oxidoreductase [Alphaproteobacteria bacterium GM202ARS2]|nr:SDR family oxidoreductase [Alphaproteobacteria bacterium GM202ARS2]
MPKAPPLPLMLITGASRRIGAAMARHFAPRFRLALHSSKDNDDLRNLVTNIEGTCPHVQTFFCDFLHDNPAQLIDSVIATMGFPQCTVNNASLFLPDRFDALEPSYWHEHMCVNLHAPLRIIQALHHKRPKNQQACIINMTDQRVHNLTPFFTSYTLSKSALWTLTRTAALALAPNTRVNAIAPGPILPGGEQSPEDFEQQCGRMPLQRGGTIEDINRAIQMFIDSPSITGETIAIDGGQNLGWMHKKTPQE